ncbi:Putative membrane protein [Salinibacillus kushneri]|uniref:Putative membrane protein n=1 Tax=Salinibacillus kushneri TaxID=237682 RepID=A0A1H9Y7K7_9BACI|nr:YuiB family protein [Salinibacillus kushneri]SES64795.1 Putative membrane protein [Salinibacillus kushneri]
MSEFNILHLIIGSLLFFVLFFGVAFILNMLLRKTWVMAFIYPFIVLLIVDDFKFGNYFSNTGWAIKQLGSNLIQLKMMDIVILTMGFAGTIVSGIVIRTLRSRGYQMF